jgi:small subunit ribosomal protein S6
LIECVRRVGADILNNRGVLRKIEFLGCNSLPSRLPDKVNPKDHKLKAAESNFFVLHFDSSSEYSAELTRNKLKVDSEILKHTVRRKESILSEDYECTLHEELQAPAHRPSVQKLIQEGRKPEKAYETGHFNNW